MTAAVAYLNLADSATVSASSAYPLLPASRLLDPHVARKWRATTNAASLIFDFGTNRDVDTFALFGCNLTAAGAARVRVSSTDASVQSGTTYDSGLVTGLVDPAYGYLVVLSNAVVTGRYVRFDIADASLSYVEAGRALISQRTTFAENFAPGWSRGWMDRSRKTESRGGQTFIDRELAYRTVEVTFEFLSSEERTGAIETIDRVMGESADILFIADPDSDNLGRESLYGLIDGNQPVVQPYSIELYRKTFRLRERL